MVSIVIISHSHELAAGVRAMALQMCPGSKVVITSAGGLEDNSLGTSFDKIEQAVNDAYSEDGVLVLMDLGSAVMTAQTFLETLSPEKQTRIRLSSAPLVEGAMAAVSASAAGQNLAEVQRAAEHVLRKIPKIASFKLEEENPLPSPAEDDDTAKPTFSLDLSIPNSDGIHARPAMQLVKTASRFRAHITLQNLTQHRAPVNAKMPMQLAFGGAARQGETIRIKAVGDDAEKALATLQSLIENGFDEFEKGRLPSSISGKPASVGIQTPAETLPKRFRGIGASEGYASAPAFVYRPEIVASRSYAAPDTISPKKEFSRLKRALQKAGVQLEKLQMQVQADLDEKTAWIFEFHRMILEDTEFIGRIEQRIRDDRITADEAVRTSFAWWEKQAEAPGSSMKARAADLKDVENRILRILSGCKEDPWSAMKNQAIVIAADLTPSDLTRMKREFVTGIATAYGSTASHSAILARNWRIPAVMGVGQRILSVPQNTSLALDGKTGVIEIEPSPEIIAAYQAHAEQEKRIQVELMSRAHLPAVTRDGKQVQVMANAGDLDTVREALRCGADGIGLLRTEFIYLNRAALPEEETQVPVYREIADAMAHRPVIMRTLDAGGDKDLPFINTDAELNPCLGLRAIRLCLKRPDIFQPQLRAMLRAATAGNVKIMFPMITAIEEVSMAKEALSTAGRTLIRDGLGYAKDIEIGIMIETPAAALKSERLMKEVDFVSIGSNDLTQYTLACDRGNPGVAHLFETRDPAVLGLIRRVIESGRAAGKKVELCGEFAAEREAVPLLLGLGLDVFSVPPARLAAVKHWIRRSDTADCRREARKMFGSAF